MVSNSNIVKNQNRIMTVFVSAVLTIYLSMVVQSLFVLTCFFLKGMVAWDGRVTVLDYMIRSLLTVLTRPHYLSLADPSGGGMWAGAAWLPYAWIFASCTGAAFCHSRQVFKTMGTFYLIVILVVTQWWAFGIGAKPWWCSIVGILAIVSNFGIGVLLERYRLRAEETLAKAAMENNTKRKPHNGPYKLGFTILELLVVIGITLVVAGIVIVSLQQGLKSARVAEEINQARQIYVAVNLYESDHDREPPVSLIDLEGAYLPSKSLTSNSDERLKLPDKDWPSNLWIILHGIDPLPLINARSKAMNSYFYLKNFEARFAKGRTYEEYRSRPEFGMITGAGLLKCGTCVGERCIGNCDYWPRRGYPLTVGHPAANLSGPMVTVRMDGSVHVRRIAEGCPGAQYGHLALFFNQGDIDCKGTIGLEPN